jgi:hypothetical protein
MIATDCGLNGIESNVLREILVGKFIEQIVFAKTLFQCRIPTP